MTAKCRPGLAGLGAGHAALHDGIDLKPRDRDFLAAVDAKAEITRSQARERSIDTPEPPLAPDADGLGHGLNLKRVHPRQATDPCLVEFNRAAFAGRGAVHGQQAVALVFEALPDLIGI